MPAPWEPPLSPKQRLMYRCPKRIQLATGPRFAGKTWVVENAIIKHGWHNQTRIGIVSMTSRAGLLGVWPELTGTIFNSWVDAGIASKEADFGWIKPPWVHAVTKISQAVMRNKYGTETELYLFPIERPEEAKDKLFSTQWGCLWISESHLYPTDEMGGCDLFKTARMQLRLPSVPFREQRLFCDANPPKDGKSHWLYKTFYENRVLAEEEFPDYWDADTRKSVVEMRDDLAVFEFSVDDNTFLDPGQKASVHATYAHDRDEYRRFVLGEWIDVKSPDAVFRTVWSPEAHVVGKADSADESEWEVIAPSNGMHVLMDGGTPELGGGWDPGETNHAWVAVQPWYSKDNLMCFDVLDELFFQRGDEKDDMSAMSITELTHRIMARRKSLREFAGFDMSWRDFSDSSALKFRTHATKEDWTAMPSEEELVDAALVEEASDDEIQLIGSGQLKKPGWQRKRVTFLAQLLKAGRIRVSANCKWVIRMFEKLKKASDPKSKTYLDPVQTEKHIFDALSYVICMYLLDEMTFGHDSGPVVRRRVHV